MMQLDGAAPPNNAAVLSVPWLHTAAVEFVDPAGHTYRALQGPLQLEFVRPDTDPYRPASHGPLQLADVSPYVEPYRPAGQLVHDIDDPVLYCPGGHNSSVVFSDADGQ